MLKFRMNMGRNIGELFNICELDTARLAQLDSQSVVGFCVKVH